MFRVLSCLFVGILVSNASWARPLSEQPGWEFTFSINIGYSKGKSQFNTDNENKVTEDVTNNGESHANSLVYPFGRVQYTLDSLKTQFYVGNSQEQISTAQLQYEMGLTHQFDDASKLTFAVFPKLSLLNETWSDPFLTNNPRETTKEHTGGARLAVEQIFGSPLTVKYAVASSSIDNELSGRSRLTDTDTDDIALLERDSVYQRVTLESMLPISKGILLQPALQYTNRNAKGDANSYDQYTGSLGLLVIRKKYFWVTTIQAGIRHYQAINPIFNKKQDLAHAGIFSIYSYHKPFNWDRWSWTMMAGYNQEKSDITFYDNNGFIFSTGLAYKY